MSFLLDASYEAKPFAYRQEKPLHAGVRTGCHYLLNYLLSLSVCLWMCNICRFYWMRELYEGDFYKPGIYGSGHDGLTRGTGFIARRFEVVAVAGLLWISWCVLGAALFRGGVRFSFFERTRPAASMMPPCLIYLSNSIRVQTVIAFLVR